MNKIKSIKHYYRRNLLFLLIYIVKGKYIFWTNDNKIMINKNEYGSVYFRNVNLNIMNIIHCEYFTHIIPVSANLHIL